VPVDAVDRDPPEELRERDLLVEVVDDAAVLEVRHRRQQALAGDPVPVGRARPGAPTPPRPVAKNGRFPVDDQVCEAS
jgi:hypothetical protein